MCRVSANHTTGIKPLSPFRPPATPWATASHERSPAPPQEAHPWVPYLRRAERGGEAGAQAAVAALSLSAG
eukprot:365600-Chlamydomonas_euryale.AAC.7